MAKKPVVDSETQIDPESPDFEAVDAVLAQQQDESEVARLRRTVEALTATIEKLAENPTIKAALESEASRKAATREPEPPPADKNGCVRVRVVHGKYLMGDTVVGTAGKTKDGKEVVGRGPGKTEIYKGVGDVFPLPVAEAVRLVKFKGAVFHDAVNP